jgi:hypothetical protein
MRTIFKNMRSKMVDQKMIKDGSAPSYYVEGLCTTCLMTNSLATRKYPEVHGKVVDFITHTIDDGTLYFTVRFTDQTSFCVRYACDMFAVGAELSDWQSGGFHIIREYMKPIPR